MAGSDLSFRLGKMQVFADSTSEFVAMLAFILISIKMIMVCATIGRLPLC